jgi:hypothetical protein
LHGDINWDVDFTAQGFAPEMHAVTVENGSNQFSTTSLETRFHTLNVPLGNVSGHWYGLPSSRLALNEAHKVQTDVSSGTKSQNAYVCQGAPADVTIHLPDAFGSAGVQTYATSPAALFEFSWDAYPTATMYVMGVYSQDYTVSWTGVVSPGWLGARATYDYRQPRLSALAGWSSAWDLPSSGTFPWYVGAGVASNGVLGFLGNCLGSDGMRGGVALESNQIDVP